ncbi:MAG: TatD family hydrolase, partial [Burkholderiaceae bacterium]
MYTDSHCHLDFPGLAENLTAVLQRMQQASVTRALCVSVTLEDFPRVLAVADSAPADGPTLFASAGVHPDYPDCMEPTVEQLCTLAGHPKVIATGETGLDYYRATTDPALTHEWQRDRFRVHIRAARQCGKPLIIHTRSASDDTIAIMREEQAQDIGGVMHCFTETLETARAALDLGFFISFSGIVTFRDAADLREVARFVPSDRILIETDSPYLAPIPHRGKTNEPGFVSHVGDFLAELRGMDRPEFADLTSINFDRCFRLL